MATTTEPAPWTAPPIPESIVPEEAFDVGEPGKVGLIEFARGPVEINAGRESKEMVLVNTGDRPIQIGGHYHLAEANKAMAFDREAAFGFRLDIPSGSAIRFEPGQSRKVKLTRFAGAQVSMGMNDLTNGSMRSEATKRQAMRRLREQDYCFEDDTADNRRRADELRGATDGAGKPSRASSATRSTKSSAKPARTRRKSS